MHHKDDHRVQGYMVKVVANGINKQDGVHYIQCFIRGDAD